MPTNLFSKRQKLFRGEITDVYQYSHLPHKLRVQIYRIVKEALGVMQIWEYQSPDLPAEIYSDIHRILCREYGVFKLGIGANDKDNDRKILLDYILDGADIEKVLDIIELLCRAIEKIIKPNERYAEFVAVELSPDEAITELNERFKENSIGYQYTSGEIIKFDNNYTHSEILKPTLTLLSGEKFRGANEEYLKAHEYYRHGRNKECLAECGKAFESVMKIICKEKGWDYDINKDTAVKLVKICFNNGLVPEYTQNQFTSLQNLLESGIAPIRNRLGSHGDPDLRKVSDEITRYALNLTGTNILFLAEQSGIK